MGVAVNTRASRVSVVGAEGIDSDKTVAIVSVMSNDYFIRSALDTILAPHDAAWEKGFVDAYVANAHAQVKEYGQTLAEADEKHGSWTYRPTRYVKYIHETSLTVRAPHSLVQYREAYAAGLYVANVEAATKDGEEAYRNTREAFILHTIEKLGYACQGVSLKDAAFQGDITLGRMIEGYLNVTFGSTTIRVTLQVKTNYRYGRNSENGHLTVYSQYPLRFVYAVVNGEQLSGILSEELLANKISGIPMDFKLRKTQAEKDAKAAKRAEKDKLDALRRGYGKIIDAYDSIAYHTRNYEALSADRQAESSSLKRIGEHKAEIVQLCAKYGITDPGSKKAALAARKDLIAKTKAMGSVR